MIGLFTGTYITLLIWYKAWNFRGDRI